MLRLQQRQEWLFKLEKDDLLKVQKDQKDDIIKMQENFYDRLFELMNK